MGEDLFEGNLAQLVVGLILRSSLGTCYQFFPSFNSGIGFKLTLFLVANRNVWYYKWSLLYWGREGFDNKITKNSMNWDTCRHKHKCTTCSYNLVFIFYNWYFSGKIFSSTIEIDWLARIGSKNHGWFTGNDIFYLIPYISWNFLVIQ